MTTPGQRGALAGLAVGWTAIYGLALTRHITEDAIKYVRDSLVGGEALFHPHHLFYHGLMAAAVWMAGAGTQNIERSVLVMQWTNVVFSVACVLVFYGICLRVGVSSTRALLLALMFGASSAFFEFSSQVEVYNLTALCSCVSLYGIVAWRDSRWRRFLVGAGYFFAMGFHQVGIFLGVAILLGESLRQPRRARWARLVPTFLVPLAAIAVAYGATGWSLGLRSPQEIWQWITLYGHMPYWGLGRFDAPTLRNLAVGVGRALVDVSVLANGMIVPALLGLVTFLLLQGRRVTWQGHRAVTLLASAGWLVAYGLFMAWWDAGNVESWIIPCVPLFVLVALAATAEPPAGQKRLAWSGLLLFFGIMLVADAAFVRRDRQPNRALDAALLLQRSARAGDLVLALDSDKGAYYDLHLLHRGVRVEPINLDLAQAAAASGGDAAFTGILLGEIRDLVRNVQARGGRCFVDTWVVQAEISPIRHMRDIDPDRFRAGLRQSFALRPLAPGDPPLLFEIAPTQPASEPP